MPDKHGGGHVNRQGCLAMQVAHLPAQPLHLALCVAGSLFCHHSKRPACQNAATQKQQYFLDEANFAVPASGRLTIGKCTRLELNAADDTMEVQSTQGVYRLTDAVSTTQ